MIASPGLRGAFVLFAGGVAWTQSAPPPDPAVPLALTPAITIEELEAHVAFLASDELAGRKTGTPQAVEAARYLAGVLERSGVAPAGDEGTYLQRVPMSTLEYRAAPYLRVLDSTGAALDAVPGVDFELLGGCCEAASLDVLTIRADSDLPAQARAGQALFFDCSPSQRREWLSKTGYEDGTGWRLWIQAGSTTAGRAPSSPVPRARSGGSSVARISVRGPLRERFLKGEIARVEFAAPAAVRELETYNVLGRIAGAGQEGRPELAQQVVVVSAHYDHLGLREPPVPALPDAPPPDLVYNGADDDASGCAAVLELAGALASGPAPARTLVVLLATGEEIGLVGTRHYLAHPSEPLARTVANLNFEMLGRPDPLAGGSGSVWLTGFERTNLGASFQALGLPLVPDPRPGQDFYRRSDNYAFARLGIVAQTLSSYNLHEDYHTVHDEAERIDFQHLAACVRASLDGLRALADGRVTPDWLPGGKE